MSWQLERREGEWVVLDAEGSAVGSHLFRADAIKHQKALFANEARVAAMYAELDALPDPEPEVEALPVSLGSRVVKIEIPTDEALTASVMQQMERMNERQARTDQALVAALEAIGAKENVFNVHASPVTVEPAQITVNPAPITVESPTVHVEAPTVNVPPVQVTVKPADVNVVLPERQKTVTFERDPLTQQVTKAEVVET